MLLHQDVLFEFHLDLLALGSLHNILNPQIHFFDLDLFLLIVTWSASIFDPSMENLLTNLRFFFQWVTRWRPSNICSRMVSDCIILLICFRIFDITIFCKKIVVYELKMFTSHKPQMAVEWETKGMF